MTMISDKKHDEKLFLQMRELIACGEQITIQVKGRSMSPTFKDGVDVIRIATFKPEDLKVGDVVFFDRGDQMCVHRIIARNGDKLVIRGDGNSVKALERVSVSAVAGLIVGGTFKGGVTFSVEDEAWKKNTERIFKYFPLIAAWHRLAFIAKKYPCSMVATMLLLFLSFFNPHCPMPDIPGNDKTIHAVMYMLLSLMYWAEWIRCHKGVANSGLKAFMLCTVFPVLMGGLIELGQAYLVTYRSGEWGDFLANTVGSLIALAIISLIIFPMVKSRKARAIIILVLINLMPLSAKTVVKPGIEVLEEMNFAPLQGKRVGLVTNPSGVDHNLRSTIDILKNAPGVNLVALYGPEHGVRGDVYAGGHVADYTDPATGLPVYSLYGPTRKPTSKMLEGIDVIVYDIQDVGARCYTFISTMGLVMEACAPLGIEVVVLDRPNPLGGEKIEGCYVEQPFNSFVSQYKIPFVYGLTPGELALLINEEGLNRGQLGNQAPVKCKLTVIPMKGWNRSMTYEETGLPWVLPSPNIPHAETALYYPVAGMCGEIYNYLQVGLSYTIPFQAFAAAWIDADKLLAELKTYDIPGVEFRPLYYRPFSGSQAGKLVSGVQPFLTDYDAVRLTEVQFYVMQALAKLYPEHLPFGPDEKIGLFNKVCGTNYIHDTFSKSYKVEDILQYWRKDEEAFRSLSSTYYLY